MAPTYESMATSSPGQVRVMGPVIVGGGPSGLAAAACLKEKGIPSLILERESCIASLWKHKTYDRLRLHIPKHFCELPLMPFPSHFPTYPTKYQFLDYLEAYAKHFDINLELNKKVVAAEFDNKCGVWRVRAEGGKREETVYVCQWVIVATGENANEFIPEMEGMKDFGGPVIHSSFYRIGDSYAGKKVLVVGCGNSGMEVCLDLCNCNALPSLAVRDRVHVLPQEMLGISTFQVSTWLMKWLPVWLVDQFLLGMARLTVGDTARIGLPRPKKGPFQLKHISGKTPVLDLGTLVLIRNGKIKVFPGIKRLIHHAVEFVDGRVENFDAIILATGYKSNVPSWLKDNGMFSEKDGFPRETFPRGWKGQSGLYAVGFTKRGLLGASHDARKTAEDIGHQWKAMADFRWLC